MTDTENTEVDPIDDYFERLQAWGEGVEERLEALEREVAELRRATQIKVTGV